MADVPMGPEREAEGPWGSRPVVPAAPTDPALAAKAAPTVPALAAKANDLEALRTAVIDSAGVRILSEGLHEFLDLMQQQLIAVTRDLSTAFFGYSLEAAQAQTATPQ